MGEQVVWLRYGTMKATRFTSAVTASASTMFRLMKGTTCFLRQTWSQQRAAAVVMR